MAHITTGNVTSSRPITMTVADLVARFESGAAAQRVDRPTAFPLRQSRTSAIAAPATIATPATIAAPATTTTLTTTVAPLQASRPTISVAPADPNVASLSKTQLMAEVVRLRRELDQRERDNSLKTLLLELTEHRLEGLARQLDDCKASTQYYDEMTRKLNNSLEKKQARLETLRASNTQLKAKLVEFENRADGVSVSRPTCVERVMQLVGEDHRLHACDAAPSPTSDRDDLTATESSTPSSPDDARAAVTTDELLTLKYAFGHASAAGSGQPTRSRSSLLTRLRRVFKTNRW